MPSVPVSKLRSVNHPSVPFYLLPYPSISYRIQVDLEEAVGRISDLQAINNNLTSIKNKLETELSTAQADLDEVTKELHAADERANRALADAARAVEQLHEEQEHSMKIDALRKSLEEQVKQLQVQIQEAEAAALLGGKRVISKLETRIRDLETALDEETRRHKETQNALRKKDRRIKEVQQLVREGRGREGRGRERGGERVYSIHSRSMRNTRTSLWLKTLPID